MTLFFEYRSVSRYRVNSFSYYRVHSHKVQLVVTIVVTTDMCSTLILNTGSGKTLPGVAGRGGGWTVPGLYIESWKDIAGCGGERDDGLLHHAGLLAPPHEHPVVHVQLVLLQEALARRVPGLHLSQKQIVSYIISQKSNFSSFSSVIL